MPMQCHVAIHTYRIREIEETSEVETEDPLMVGREILDLEPVDLRSVGDTVQEELSGRNILEPDLGPDLRLEHLTVP
jgi:hypothetical protein